MCIRSYTSTRWLSRYVLTLLLVCGFISVRTEAQATAPTVTASFASTLTPPAAGLSKVFQTAVDSFGDLLVVDWGNGALYEYPAGGGAVITLLPKGSLGSYSNPGIAIGAENDLYLEGNYNNCLLRFPYDSAKNTWDGLSTISAANGFASTAPCPNGSGGSYTAQPPYGFSEGGNPGVKPYYFQPWAIAIDPKNNVLITAQNGNFIFDMPVVGTGATSKPGTATSLILDASTVRAQSVAEDKFGNVYFVEEADQADATKKIFPLPGVLMIPAGSTNVASDAGLTRVDPNLPAVTGVAVDPSGNLYISDSKVGVVMVPNPTGTPQTSSSVLLTPAPAFGQASMDMARGVLYVPGYDASGAQVMTAVSFETGEFGATASGAPAATPGTVQFAFNGAVTPASFVIQEAGTKAPDFVIASGGTCAAKTAYAAQSSCTVNVTLAPHAAGSVSAKLLMLDGSGNTLASITLHGTGTGSAVQVLPGSEAAMGSGLKAPGQLAVDPGGNVYVADSVLGAVDLFPKGAGSSTAGTAVGTGVVAPTGVAVDGAGDVFIADSGNIVEVPAGTSGLNAAGQITLKTGLGTNLRLAADGSGNLFVADPDNHRIVRIGNPGGTFSLGAQTESDLTGFNAPSAIAVDAAGNLYVADGSNLFEVTPGGSRSTLLSTLSNVSGLAVDASGSVYVTTSGTTTRIPNLGGTLTPGSQTTIAPDVTTAASVAIDAGGDLYIANTAGGDVQMVSASSAFDFGTLTSTSGSASQSFTILNDGNSPLNISGFAGTPDYTETGTTCSTALALSATCSVTITFSPGPGDQGTLSGEVLVTGDEANAPVGVNATGVGAALAGSATAVSITNPTADGAPAVVTVTPTSGAGAAMPTGQVTLTITGGSLTTPVTVTGTLAAGKVTLTPPLLPVGAYTFAVSYQGDRTYGSSNASSKVTIGQGAITIVQPTPAQIQAADPSYPYVLAAGAGAQEPYDGSVTQFEYSYEVQILTPNGAKLIGVPVYNKAGKQVATNYGSITFQGAPTSSCTAIPVAADGTATFSTDCFTIDTTNSAIPDILTSYSVTPVYTPAGTGASSGNTNPNYASVTGTAISFTAIRNPMVQIASNPGSLSLSAGSTATATLTLSSVLGYGVAGAGALLNNYSLPVQLACDGLPAYATCTFTYPTPDPSDPQSVDVGPTAGTVLSYMGGASGPCTKAQRCTGPGTVIVTINTNVSPGTVASLHSGSSEVTFAAIFGVGIFGLAFGRKRSIRSRIPVLLCLFLVSVVMAAVSGCSTTQLGTSNGNLSPKGTYNVSITAKQVGSQTIAQTPGIVYGNGNQVSIPFTMKVTIQ